MALLKKSCALLLSALLLLPPLAWARPAFPRDAQRPKLVVLLVVDQMRADYIDRYGQQWTRGLKRLLDRGAWFRLAAYPYWNTITCAGHATISTGSFPSTHGMIQNTWWDRDSTQIVACTEDAGAENISLNGPRRGGDSPVRLLVPAFADELRTQTSPPARIVSMSIKARSAIMMAGRRADVAVWFGGAAGWLTSSSYTRELPSFVQRFANQNPVEADLGKEWTKLLPENAYLFSDGGDGERPPQGWSKKFPHTLGKKAEGAFYTGWETSPFADAYLASMAGAAVDELRLGQRNSTDMLAVSFSALDVVGHRFGPRSHEVQDALARLDGAIGALLDHLDRRVGRENYVVALSADHGVAAIPEQMKAEGLDAGRVSTQEVAEEIEKALKPILGQGPHVARVHYTELYFKSGVFEKLKADPRAMRAVEEAVLSVRGVWRVFRGDELEQREHTHDPVAQAAALSYLKGRSGDMVILSRPYWFPAEAATTHGSGHSYDARVPVILMGRGIRPGEYLAPATPADIAPTFAFLCGITMAHTDGRVLIEALESAAPRGQGAGDSHTPAN